MQKSMKRLLSALAVLALVLTMAPAGILAVETKAEVQSNLPDGIAELKAEAAAIQEAAKTALTDGYCPVCDKPVEWVALPGGTAATRPASTDTQVHYYIPDGFTSTAANAFLTNDMSAGATACLLLQGNATLSGRFLFYSDKGVTINIMGEGYVNSTSTGYGLLSVTCKAKNEDDTPFPGSNTVLNLYGGQFSSKGAALEGATIYQSNKLSTINIWNDAIIGGNEVPTASSAAHFSAYLAGTLNLYDGTIQNGKYNAALASTSYPTYKAGNVQLNGTANFNMYGGVVKNGYGSRGGNIYINSGADVNIYAGEIKDGYSVYTGGNIYHNGGTAAFYVNGAVTGGTAGTQGGNIYVCNNATVELGNVDISGGTSAPDSSLSSNVRIATGTLKLSGNTHANGILMTSADSLVVTPNFSGDVTVWHTTAVVPGAAVPKSSATGAFTGIVRNSNWLYTAAANGASDVYIPVAMEWDGATGLKYAAQGVVYNGTLTPAANGQAAVDAYVAAMADETVEEKPQYVYITEDVQLKDGAEVAIWAGADITVSGNGVVAGVDRKNDNYAANGAAITVADQVTVAKEVKAGGRRYIALSDATVDANKYTFHRVETKLTNVTVNVANAGIYYKAEYQFDEIVKDRIASYGVNVNLEGSTKEGQTSSSDTSIYDAESHTLTAKSHGVYGIFKDTNLASTNKENGQIKLCGNPYLAINTTGNMESSDCPEFTAAESTKMSLADAMEMANEKWEAINEEGKPMLKEFFAKWLKAGAWDAEWAAKLTNLIPAEA